MSKTRKWGYHGLSKYCAGNTNGKSTLCPVFLMFLCFAHFFISKKVLTVHFTPAQRPKFNFHILNILTNLKKIFIS